MIQLQSNTPIEMHWVECSIDIQSGGTFLMVQLFMYLPPSQNRLIHNGKFTVNFVQVKTEKGYSYYCKLNIPIEGTLKYTTNHAMDLMESFKLQKELDHPQIAKVYRRRALHDSVQIKQEPYMKLLETHIGITYTEKIRIILSIAKTLQFLKTKKIVVRDLCPTHIGILGTGSNADIKIIRMTEAVVLSEHQKIKFPAPKSESIYLAPQVRDHKDNSYKSDVWSLGCILCFMIFGSLKGFFVYFDCVQFNFPKSTPSWLIEIIEKMMAFKASERYSIEDVINRLKFMSQCSEAAEKFIPTSWE